MTKTRKPYNSYTREFKLEVVRLMEEPGRPSSRSFSSNRTNSQKRSCLAGVWYNPSPDTYLEDRDSTV
ncbi:MAG: hypothetical protein OXC69_06235 [Candidatus Tectomicrobia bacterium]|nr:hypothetical protein [Candidatus Tectomicrobia bacterium]